VLNAPFRLHDRRSERVPVRKPALSLEQWGEIDRVIVSDLSRHGCGLTTNIVLRSGERVILRAGNLLGAVGTVRWTEVGRAGVEFDGPISPQVDLEFRNPKSTITMVVTAKTADGDKPEPAMASAPCTA
jgi:hypothetical protein